MDDMRFDRLARMLGDRSSRRALLVGLPGLGLTASLLPAAVAARKRKRKHHRLRFNLYGCVDVGRPCLGRNENCCSGICEGSNPKPWQRDRSKCVAHDVGGCTVGQDSCTSSSPLFCGTLGMCLRTTGKASYCAFALPGGFTCMDCRTDSDCEPLFGSRAACIACPRCSSPTQTACAAPGL